MKSLKKQLTLTRLILFVVIIATIGILVISNRSKQAVIPEVSLYTVKVDDVVNRVQVQGTIAAVESRNVNISSGAKVLAVDVATGSTVSAGSRLARIQKNTGLSTIEEDVTSPIAGTVVQTNVAVGDVVVGTNAFTVANTSSYVASLQINENDIANIAKDQSAQIVIPAIDLNSTYTGTVSKVGLLPINSAVINYSVEVAITKPSEKIRLGMSADVTITTQTVKDVLAVPDSYILEKDGNYYLKVLTWNDEAKTSYSISEQQVEVGLRTSELSEIVSGVKQNQVVVAPSFIQPKSFSIFGGSN